MFLLMLLSLLEDYAMRFALICCLIGALLGGGVVFVVSKPGKDVKKETPVLPASAPVTPTVAEPEIHKVDIPAKLIGSWTSMQRTPKGVWFTCENYFKPDGTIVSRLPAGNFPSKYTVIKSTDDSVIIEITFSNGEVGRPIKLEFKTLGKGTSDEVRVMLWHDTGAPINYVFSPDNERETSWAMFSSICTSRNQ